MRHCLVAMLTTVLLVGCAHRPVGYTPSSPAGMTQESAEAVIERAFHEDFRRQPEAVQVTEEAIVLSEGFITKSSSTAVAVPVAGSAVGMGSSTSRTKSAAQYIYLDSLLPSVVLKRTGRDHQYAVTIMQEPGVAVRHVYFRTQFRAQEFADALEWLRQSIR